MLAVHIDEWFTNSAERNIDVKMFNQLRQFCLWNNVAATLNQWRLQLFPFIGCSTALSDGCVQLPPAQHGIWAFAYFGHNNRLNRQKPLCISKAYNRVRTFRERKQIVPIEGISDFFVRVLLNVSMTSLSYIICVILMTFAAARNSERERGREKREREKSCCEADKLAA